MAKPFEIVLKNWHRGISNSPYTGFGFMQNVEVDRVPGILMPSIVAAKQSGTTITGLPKWEVRDTDANATSYVVDDLHRVYTSTAASGYATWTLLTHASASTGTGNGLLLAKCAGGQSVLLLFGNTKIDLYRIDTATWYNDWKTLTLTTGEHPVLQAQSNIIYFGNGKDVGSISDLTIGAPPTATVSTAAMTSGLPLQYKVSCLEELGSNLAIGTIVRTTAAQLGRNKIADIFLWDKSSSSFSSVVRLAEDGINQIKTINNLLYIQAGNSGNFYVSNISTTRLLLTIPKNMLGRSSWTSTQTYPNGILYHKGRIFSGITFIGTPASSGVYSFNLDGTGLVMENAIETSSGNIDLSANTLIPVLAYAGDSGGDFNYMIGWGSTGSTFGISNVGLSSSDYGSYLSFVDSPIYFVGKAINKPVFNLCEIYLERSLASGGGVRIAYRRDNSESFTTHTTFDFATDGAVQKKVFHFSVQAEQIQWRISLSGLLTRVRQINFT